MMSLGVQIVAGWMAFVFLFGLALLAWALYSGQLDDDDAKYVPFREREPEGWKTATRSRRGSSRA